MSDFSDAGVDADADGKFEQLVISAQVAGEAAGTYDVNGKLVAPDGTEVGRTQGTVSVGTTPGPLSLVFDGAAIGATGKDGPYTLRDLTLYPQSNPSGGTSLVDAYTTGPYRSAQFPGGVQDDLPMASFEVSAVGLDVTVDASASSDDQGVTGYAFEFGDGGTASTAVAKHTYAKAGTYEITLTVTDTAGQTSEVKRSVTVAPAVATCNGKIATQVMVRRGKFIGTAGPDVVIGTSGADEIVGAGGDDTICGMGGADDISGGAGNDWIFGGDDADSISGGAGVDTIDGGAGDDQITGGDGDDSIAGGTGKDVLNAGNGNDELSGGEDNDSLIAGSGADHLHGGAGDDELGGGDGNDMIFADSGADVVRAGSGNDVVMGGTENDQIYGGDGDDQLNGEEGDDRLWGEKGNDTLTGGDGDDVLDGGSGRNTLLP